MKVVYTHRIAGENKPFFIGSGSIVRAHVLENRPSRWASYVGAQTAAVEVEVIERHVCEGQARYREAELIGQHNPPANFIAAVRSSSDMLTGRAKGAGDCTCGTADCRMLFWNSLSEGEREAMIAEHRARVLRNKAERNESIRPRKGVEMKKGKQMERMSAAMNRCLAEFLDAEASGREPELVKQQRGTTARALVVTEGMTYEAAVERVRATF